MGRVHTASLIFLFLFPWFNDCLFAQPVPIQVDKEKELNITSSLMRCSPVNQINSGPDTCRLMGNKKLMIKAGDTETILQFAIVNEIRQPLYLLISDPLLKTADLAISDINGFHQEISFGHTLPSAKRPIQQNALICPIPFQEGLINCRLALSSALSSQATIYLIPQSQLYVRLHSDNLVFGIFFGILLAVILINLFVYIILIDTTYLYYSAYQLSNLLLLSVMNGLLGELVFSFEPSLSLYLFLFIGVSGIFSILFSLRFLKIKEWLPGFFRMSLALMALNGLSILFMLTGYFQWSIVFSEIITLVNAALLITGAFLVLRKGEQQALYFILGWSCFVVGMLSFLAVKYGVLPDNFVSSILFPSGISLEGVLVTLAIVQRIQWLSHINSETQDKLLKTYRENELLIKEKNEDLEKKVEERTSEVNFAFQRLEALKQFYESALNNLPLDISVFDGNARFIFFNRTALRDRELNENAIGKTETEFAGMYIRNIEMPSQRQEMILKAIQNGEKGIMEEVYYNAQGDKIVKQRIILPVYDAQGQFLYVMGIGIDITERSRYNQQINLQKEFYEKILNSIPIDIHVLSPDLKYLFLNIHSVRDDKIREWMIGKTNTDYCKFRGLDVELFLNRDSQFTKALAKKEIVEFEEYIMLKEDRMHVIHRNIKPVFDAQGLPLMLVSFGFDITNLKEIEKQLTDKANELERSNRDLENFAHMASHDFKAPLRVIHSFLQLLEKRSYQKFDETDKEYINYISNSVRILGQLTEDLLSYSKIDKNIGDPQVFELGSVLELVKANLKAIIDERKALVEFGPMPKVFAHMSLLTHLFQNLINNGIKYNRSEIPRIEIRLLQQKDEFIFSIADNGIGIEPEYFRSIFQMFRRLHPHSEYEGSGIGLTLCKKIVETYGGEIWVESRPGQGSTFFFTLPKAMITQPVIIEEWQEN